MHIKSTLLAAAALSAQAAAEFIVITDYPSALQTLSPQAAQSYLSSILPGIRSELLGLATDSSYIARATSVLPQLQEFAATATISLPAHVTALDQFQIYTTVPPWYSQLPSGVRSLYDDVGRSIEGVLNDNPPPTPAGNVTSSVSAQATPTGNVTVPSGTGAVPPEHTGGVGKLEIGLVGGVVAGVAGLVML